MTSNRQVRFLGECGRATFQSYPTRRVEGVTRWLSLTTGEPLGIMVAQTPILLDVPLSQIRTLPQSYRQADTLAIASQVAIIPQSDRTIMTVFILDLAKVI